MWATLDDDSMRRHSLKGINVNDVVLLRVLDHQVALSHMILNLVKVLADVPKLPYESFDLIGYPIKMHSLKERDLTHLV